MVDVLLDIGDLCMCFFIDGIVCFWIVECDFENLFGGCFDFEFGVSIVLVGYVFFFFCLFVDLKIR